MLLSISMTHRIFIFMIIVMSMAIFTLATLDDALSRSVVTLTSSDNLKDPKMIIEDFKWSTVVPRYVMYPKRSRIGGCSC